MGQATDPALELPWFWNLAYEQPLPGRVFLAKGSETRVWGRYADGPGTPMKGEPVPNAVKALFRAP